MIYKRFGCTYCDSEWYISTRALRDHESDVPVQTCSYCETSICEKCNDEHTEECGENLWD